MVNIKQMKANQNKKNIKKSEEQVATLGNWHDYTFDILLNSLMLSFFSDDHKDSNCHLTWFIDSPFDS